MEKSVIKKTEEKIKATEKMLRRSKKTARLQKKVAQKQLAPDKLVLLVTVVNREKGEYYLDFLQTYCNMQMSVVAYGTAARTFGFASEVDKTVLLSVTTRESAKQALWALENKFTSIRHGKGVAFTVPMTCTIGVAIYRFLCNKE